MKKITRLALVISVCILGSLCAAQSSAPPAKKHLLALGEEKGYRHEAVSHAMATLERLGSQTGLWDTTLRTDTEVLPRRNWNSTPRT